MILLVIAHCRAVSWKWGAHLLLCGSASNKARSLLDLLSLECCSCCLVAVSKRSHKASRQCFFSVFDCINSRERPLIDSPYFVVVVVKVYVLEWRQRPRWRLICLLKLAPTWRWRCLLFRQHYHHQQQQQPICQQAKNINRRVIIRWYSAPSQLVIAIAVMQFILFHTLQQRRIIMVAEVMWSRIFAFCLFLATPTSNCVPVVCLSTFCSSSAPLFSVQCLALIYINLRWPSALLAATAAAAA